MENLSERLKIMSEKLLILGGTSEAYELAENLVKQYTPEKLTVISSLAGVTENPKIPAGKLRLGGFANKYAKGERSTNNSILGLSRYLLKEKITILINATHPYSTKISENSFIASSELSLPYLRLCRSPWVKDSNDNWIVVKDIDRAVKYLKYEILKKSFPKKQLVFLTIGKQRLELFEKCSKIDFLVRTVDLPEFIKSAQRMSAWGQTTFLTSRGPFSLDNELYLFQKFGVSLLVTKNSGGNATYPKIEAARKLKIPVLMVDRPFMNAPKICHQVNQALEWITQKKL